jgi:hypothetical protein
METPVTTPPSAGPAEVRGKAPDFDELDMACRREAINGMQAVALVRRHYEALAARCASQERELAELRAAQTAKGWRPIETAPRDGTEFQAWVTNPTVPGGGFWDSRCRFNEHGAFQTWARVDYDMEDWDTLDLIPTHWMQHPKEPT